MNPGGWLIVGLTEDETEVIINHPDLQPDANGCGHIIFSPREARALAAVLVDKADQCRCEHDYRGRCNNIDGSEQIFCAKCGRNPP